MFVTISHFHFSLIFARKARTLPLEWNVITIKNNYGRKKFFNTGP